MYELICNWYVVGLVIYVVLVACILLFEYISLKQEKTTFVFLSSWFLAFIDFIWGIINCFTKNHLFVGIVIIFCGVALIINNLVHYSKFPSKD